MHRKQPIEGVPFWECFEAYAANLHGAGALMSKCDFNKDAEQQICWNHASEGGVALSMRVFGHLIMGLPLRDCFQFIIDYKYIVL